jgi:hypothetical protein
MEDGDTFPANEYMVNILAIFCNNVYIMHNVYTCMCDFHAYSI